VSLGTFETNRSQNGHLVNAIEITVIPIPLVSLTLISEFGMLLTKITGQNIKKLELIKAMTHL